MAVLPPTDRIRYQLRPVVVLPSQVTVQVEPTTVTTTATVTPLPSFALTAPVVLGVVRRLTPLQAVIFAAVDTPSASAGATSDVTAVENAAARSANASRTTSGSDPGRTGRRTATVNGHLGYRPIRVADTVNPAHPPIRTSGTRPFRTGPGPYSQPVASTRAGWPGPLHGGSRSALMTSPPISIAPDATSPTACSGSLAVRSHQLLTRNENVRLAPGSSIGPSFVSGSVLWIRSLPDESAIATTGCAGSRQAVAPAVTLTSAPRLPAAPPQGPPVIVRSPGPQSAPAADDGDATGVDVGLEDGPLVGDVVAVADELAVGVGAGDGLGTTEVVQAATSTSETTATAT